MHWIGLLVVMLIIVGLIAGALARLLVPGKDPMGIGGTILLGIVGSFIGGFLGYAAVPQGRAARAPSSRPA